MNVPAPVYDRDLTAITNMGITSPTFVGNVGTGWVPTTTGTTITVGNTGSSSFTASSLAK